MESIFLFFVLALLSEGKMDWGLLLHCAALTFTLARALRSGECHGDVGSQPGQPAARLGSGAARAGDTAGDGAGIDLSPAGGNFVAEEAGGAILTRGSPALALPSHFISALSGCIKQAARSH